jgi:hypothetical protein
MFSRDSVSVFAGFMCRFLELPRKAAGYDLLPLKINDLGGDIGERSKSLSDQQALQVCFARSLRVAPQALEACRPALVRVLAPPLF